MRPFLLDVNVLIALAWPSHLNHQSAQRWFAGNRAAGFRTCPLTQLGFVRISCNPRFTPDAVAPGEALNLLDRMIALPEHAFWPDDLPLAKAIYAELPVFGHRQVTDAYLVALAESKGGVLATLDRGVLSLPDRGAHIVELLDSRL